MRLIAILALFAASITARAQVSVYDCSVSSPNVPAVALEASEPGNFHKPCIILDEINSYNYSNDQELHITADETIHIFEDFHSGQYTNNGNMHLQIKPQEDLDVLLMNYPDLYNVERFGKLELAVVLPQNIQDAVADFVANGQSATNVNPFDPDQLEIKAYFSPLWQGNWQYPWVRHGFYYEEYEHNADTSDWVQLPTPGSKFRIRFAPRATGLWRCAISVHCPVTGEYWDLNEFQFTVIDTGKPDFMRVGENGKYFKIGSEPYYPFGMNMPTQGRDRAYDAGLNGGTRPKDYNKFFEELHELKNAGGDYFRYMNQPYSTEIEFEALGDYSDRMSRAWEMDRIVDSLEELDMRMLYCLAYHLPFTYTGVYSQYYWDWSKEMEAGIYCSLAPNGFSGDNGYCYRSDPTHGVMLIDDFFSDSTLIAFYKKRLRYYVSRYGYSTRIGKFEFINEINTTAAQTAIDPVNCENRPDIFRVQQYYEDPNYVSNIYNWQHEMARYIKEDLGHEDHLLAANYAGAPNEVPYNDYLFEDAQGNTIYDQIGISTFAGDQSYISPYIDVRSYNDYFETPVHFSSAAQEISNFNSYFSQEPRKPFYFSEIGNGDFHNCDDMFSFQQLYIMSIFTGVASVGLPWDYNSSLWNWDDTADRLKGWEPIQVMKGFLNGIDLNHDDWRPDTDISNDSLAELVYLRNEYLGATHAIGVINNLTVNRHTMREPGCAVTNGCDCAWTQEDKQKFPLDWENPAEFDHQGISKTLKIDGVKSLKKYWVEFYDALTGQLFLIDSKWSNAFAQLKVEYPKLGDTPYPQSGETNGSMLLIKVYEDGQSSFRTSDSTQQDESYIFEKRPTKEKDRLITHVNPDQDPVKTTEVHDGEPFINVLPNPSNGSTRIEVNHVSTTKGNLNIFNAYGVLVFNKDNCGKRTTLDVSTWSKGLYFVDWFNGETHLTSKLIVK